MGFSFNLKSEILPRDIIIVPSNMFSPNLALRYDWLSRVAFLWGTDYQVGLESEILEIL